MLYLMLFCDIGYQTLGLSKRMNCRKRRKKPKTPIKKNKKIEKYSFIFAVFLDMSFNALAHYGNADQAFCCPYRAFIKTAYIVNIYQSSLQHLKPDYYTTEKAMSASNLESLI